MKFLFNPLDLTDLRPEIEYPTKSKCGTKVHVSLQEAYCGNKGREKKEYAPDGWYMEQDKNYP